MKRYLPLLVPLCITILYVVTHLWHLTNLPVFADESIYIRWAQLIMDEPARYAFFPLNDGKTPLHMWLMVPLQYLFSDQLWAGRVLSVIVGFWQMIAIVFLIRRLNGSQSVQWLGALLVSILPFWYFHHRMALIDGLLTLWLSFALYYALGILQHPPVIKKSQNWVQLVRQTLQWRKVVPLAFWIGIALWTKLTAVLFFPVILVWTWWPPKLTQTQRVLLFGQLGSGLFGGLIIFALLRLNPAFGQLFGRGGDFLYPVSEVLLQGKWQETLANIPSYIHYFGAYLTVPSLVFAVLGLIFPQQRRTHVLLWMSWLLYVLPIALLGKVVYPRYLFPAALFLTISTALSIQTIVRWVRSYSAQRLTGFAFALSLLLTVFMTKLVGDSTYFIATALLQPDAIPFVAADRVQYLTEWSSGHGIRETVDLITSESQKGSLAVATEGFFGTLPDGILLYLHNRDVTNLYVEGIGQPVRSIPETFRARAREYEKTYLVVNSHRLDIGLTEDKLVHQYCRPFAAPCLQIWDVTHLIR